MSKHIVEEIPAKGSHAKGDNPVEKQASQLAYDVKYKVKQSLGKDTKLSPAQVSRAYMAQLAKSPAPPAVKALAKKKLIGEEYTSDVASLAEKAMVNAMVKVFVEGIEEKVEEVQEEVKEKQYKIRVTDKKTGNTYVRMASRTKISELRANPNISSVEMTGYGEVSRDEKSKGAKTAATKSGKGLDPVGQEDADVNNDKKIDKTDKYLLKRRKAIGKAIATRKEEVENVNEIHSSAHTPHEVPDKNLKKLVKKAVKRIDADVDGDVDKNDPKAGDYGEYVPSPDGKKRVYTKIKEEFINEVNSDEEESKEKEIDIRKGLKNKVKVFPEVKEQVEDSITNAPKKKLDPNIKRAQQQKVALLQKKIQAIRSTSDPSIMASYEPEGEQIDEKAVSKAQQRFMGMVYAAKKGETPASPEVAKAAAGISKKEAKKFAGTKHSKLPEKVAEEKEGCDCGKTPCECDERENPTKMDLLKNKMRAKGIKVAGITPAPRNMKTADELGEAVDRAEYEKIAKEPAPKDDKKAAYAFRDNKRRQRDLKKLARLVKHAEGQKRNPAMYEAAEDRARDEHQMRGGMAARVDYDRPPAKKLSNKELGIRDFTPAEKAKRMEQMRAHLKKMGRS